MLCRGSTDTWQYNSELPTLCELTCPLEGPRILVWLAHPQPTSLLDFCRRNLGAHTGRRKEKEKTNRAVMVRSTVYTVSAICNMRRAVKPQSQTVTAPKTLPATSPAPQVCCGEVGSEAWRLIPITGWRVDKPRVGVSSFLSQAKPTVATQFCSL